MKACCYSSLTKKASLLEYLQVGINAVPAKGQYQEIL